MDDVVRLVGLTLVTSARHHGQAAGGALQGHRCRARRGHAHPDVNPPLFPGLAVTQQKPATVKKRADREGVVQSQADNDDDMPVTTQDQPQSN
jgi:hypothetical protein